jgi:hypothetical protein
MKPGGRAALVGVGVGLVAIVGIAAYSGGHQPVSCPAVARVIVVDVQISGDPAAVHDVRLCTTGGCSAPAAETRGSQPPDASTPGQPAASAPGPTPPSAPGPFATQPSPSATPDSGATPTSAPPARHSAVDALPAFPTGPETPAPAVPTSGPHFAAPRLFVAGDHLPGAWRFETLQEYPTRVSATAYGADGRALASREVDLRWRLATPGDVCDVSKVTGPVGLRVGS